jgi:Uma2 family endonuclease
MSTTVATLPEAIQEKVEIMPEELLSMPDSGHYELIDGELKERNVSVLSSLVASRIIRELGNHAEANRLGAVLPPDCGYRCFPWKPRRVRRADVSFIRADRLNDEVVSAGDCPIAPDLAVEVISPNDSAAELNLKVEEYLRAGVKLVWVIDPEIRTVDLYRSDGTTQRLRETDTLSGEDVLAGFECRVAALFPIVNQSATENPEAAAASHTGPA